jgi:hypothetical protein
MIIISAAHAPEYQGASFGVHTEYLVSSFLSSIVNRKIISAFSASRFFDLGVEMMKSGASYDQILRRKVERVNDIASISKTKNSFCVEIHLNSLGNEGTCCMYCAGSQKGEAIANFIQARLEDEIGFGRHWHGAFERPGKYGGGITFLSDTIIPALIIEIDSISNASRVISQTDLITTSVANALIEAKKCLS